MEPEQFQKCMSVLAAEQTTNPRATISAVCGILIQRGLAYTKLMIAEKEVKK